MYKIAMINTFLTLTDKYPNRIYPKPFDYSLKQLGTLFALDKLKKIIDFNSKVLEVGAGSNTFFYENLDIAGYEVIDAPRNFDEADLQKAQEKRKRAVHYEGYLGESSTIIPPN
mgnify:CR=1 FL=1